MVVGAVEIQPDDSPVDWSRPTKPEPTSVRTTATTGVR